MLITDQTIDILRNQCGEMIRCEGCDELIIAPTVFAEEEMDDESPRKVVAFHKYYGPCDNCGLENHIVD